MTSSASSMPYRPDIDGLRAVAVLSVVFCHAGLSFPGGYVGVDVFFVISGYLITGLILKDLDRGTFSLADFWVRRIRRILPALLAVTVGHRAGGLVPADPVRLRVARQVDRRPRPPRLERPVLARDRLLHRDGRGETPAPHLVPRGRGAVLPVRAGPPPAPRPRPAVPAGVLARRPGRDREPGPEHLRDAEVCLGDVLPAPHPGMGTLRRRDGWPSVPGVARRLPAPEGGRGDAGTPPDLDTLPPLRPGDAVPRAHRPRPRPGGGAAHHERPFPRPTPVGEPVPRLASDGLRRPDLLLALPLALAALRLRQESDPRPALRKVSG